MTKRNLIAMSPDLCNYLLKWPKDSTLWGVKLSLTGWIISKEGSLNEGRCTHMWIDTFVLRCYYLRKCVWVHLYIIYTYKLYMWEKMSATHFWKLIISKQDRITGIHSFGNKSIEDVFGSFFSIIVFKMSLSCLYSLWLQNNVYQLFFLGINQPKLFLGVVTQRGWNNV